jgi:hypothetical protein
MACTQDTPTRLTRRFSLFLLPHTLGTPFFSLFLSETEHCCRTRASSRPALNTTIFWSTLQKCLPMPPPPPMVFATVPRGAVDDERTHDISSRLRFGASAGHVNPEAQ